MFKRTYFSLQIYFLKHRLEICINVNWVSVYIYLHNYSFMKCNRLILLHFFISMRKDSLSLVKHYYIKEKENI